MNTRILESTSFIDPTCYKIVAFVGLPYTVVLYHVSRAVIPVVFKPFYYSPYEHFFFKPSNIPTSRVFFFLFFGLIPYEIFLRNVLGRKIRQP